jgi:non-specific serine/threonine protein kinase
VAVVAYIQGDYSSAKSLLEECLARSRAVGDDVRVMAALQNLGEVARFQGNHELAVEFFQESLEGFRAIGKKIGVLTALESLGFSEYHLGRFREARATLLEGLELAYGMGSKMHVGVFLAGLSGAALAQLDRLPAAGRSYRSPADLNEVRRAVRFLGVAAKLLESVGRQLEPLERTEFESNVATAREWLGEEVFTAVWDEGQCLTLQEAFELAIRNHPEDESQVVQPRGRGRPKKRVPSGLTDRECEVTTLLARGLTNPEIALQLVLSVRTVEAHVANVMQKLGLHTRTELAAWAVRGGITTEPIQE